MQKISPSQVARRGTSASASDFRMIMMTSLIRTFWMLALCTTINSTSAKETEDTCSKSSGWNELLLDTFRYSATTCETFLRAFCFGFGAHLLIYLFHHPDAQFQELKTRINVSAVAGLAMGCVVYGASLMLPTWLRAQWFVNEGNRSM
mmetsp:Transcript_29271/g.54963  ORF Transcript_29271/g.54963 Transcript_29271/m.54963 type:complete len:148 (+) Transcript_29271:51-494(+)